MTRELLFRPGPRRVGLRTYRLLATDIGFHRALGNTAVFALVALCLLVPLALVML
ncbi:hypothetical protein [Streptomyces sp. NPDC007929]|uniref:hypothetical protein n=1 Tax=unclassified Streptomyces TaxID=2593676 RepID=UPI0036E5E8F6